MTALPSQWYQTPDLPGDLVKLVQLHEHHAEGILAAADDDEVFRWLSVARPTDDASARDLVDHYLSLPGAIAWAQIDQTTHELAGITTFYDISAEQRTVAIGHTWLGQRFWRSGINAEAKLLLLTHAFETLQCVRVVWHTDLNNERSQAAIEGIGGVREGVLRKHKRRVDGTWRDTVIYSMTDEEWPAARATLHQRLAG